MGYDEELFHRASTLLSRAHDAHCATVFLQRKVKQEVDRNSAVADPQVKSQTQQRAAILTVATKLAAKERDDLLDELRQELVNGQGTS